MIWRIIMSINQETKNKIIALISALIPEAKIYLFGSRARGTAKQWSDIDIALDAGTPLDINRVSEVKDVLEALSIPYRVDIVDIFQVDETMKQAIMKDKQIWKP